MLPTLTQRALMLIAIVAAAFAWLAVRLPLTAAQGSSGLSLMDARIGVVLACLLLLAAGLPALISAMYVSASGNPLSGIFTTGFALMILAGQSGSMAGLIQRQQDGGGVFAALMIELGLWALAWCVLMFLIRRYRDLIRANLVPPRLQTPFSRKLTEEDTPRFVLHVAPIVAGLICSTLGYLGCRYLIATPATGQVIGSLLVVFTCAAFAAREFVPTGNVVFLVLSPLIVALAGYAHMAVSHGPASSQDLTALWQAGQITGPAMAMPIHYASAGMVGVATGIGLAQAIDRVRFAEEVITEKPDQPGPATDDAPVELGGVEPDKFREPEPQQTPEKPTE
ncbi:MAG: hypothetical protein AAGH88_03185 [Planctomycetota bacterium]